MMNPTTAALPLESFSVSVLPKTTHNIAWSPDNELAIGCDDCVLVYVPDFSLLPPPSSDGNNPRRPLPSPGYDRPRQYDEAALRFPVAPLRSPELNRHLFDAVGHEFAGYTSFTGGGSSIISGHGSTLNHTVALAWSPAGLGRMDRSVLAVLTAAGIITIYCEGSPEAVGFVGGGGRRGRSRNARTMRPWLPAWHVGGGFLVPSSHDGHAPAEHKECITAFSWAGDMGAGVAILAYKNDDHEIVILSVQATHDPDASPGHPGTWRVQETARFMAEGPHSTPLDPTDPDYVQASSSFALSWSPWLARGSSRTSMLSYVSHNYIGFRQITLDPSGAGGELELPAVHIGRADASGVCLHLSTDAFVVWEDQIWMMPGSNVCRGVIASPMKVQAFELPFDHTSPFTRHFTDKCGTTYPPEEDMPYMDNPITGLIIHPPLSSQDNTTTKTSTPSYTLVRLSATHDNSAWYQTNLRIPTLALRAQDEDQNLATPSHINESELSLRWATEISQIVEHQLPRALALAHAHRQRAGGGEIGGVGGGGQGQLGGVNFESDEEDNDDLDSDEFDDTDFDTEDDDENKDGDDGTKSAGRNDTSLLGLRGVDTEDQVHPHRVRIWGLAASPGGGTSAVFISLHSNLELERDTFAGLNCRVLFGAHRFGLSVAETAATADGDGGENANLDPLLLLSSTANQVTERTTNTTTKLSTEARAWEWMYAGGPPVPGFSFVLPPTTTSGWAGTGTVSDSGGDGRAALRELFAPIADRQLCVFCDMPLARRRVGADTRAGNSSTCGNGHIFETCANTGLPIVAPNVSHTCGVCGLKCLKSEELVRMAPDLKDVIVQDISGVLCGGCGGKFTV